MAEEKPQVQQDGAQEIDLTQFTDEAFAHQCPRCKFRFGKKKKKKGAKAS